MTFTISFGFWMVPTVLTIFGILHAGFRRPTDAWDIGGVVVMFGWGCGIVTAWIMWGLTWLAS